MLTEITIPKLTITMEGGKLLRWLKQEGASIAKDEVIFEIETDKAVAEVPSPAEGILRSILVREGDVQVGALVGFVGNLSDPIPDVAHRSESSALQAADPSAPVARPSEPVAAAPSVLRATPAAKRRAKELGVDIALVQATGPEGRLTQEDVERAAAEFKRKEQARAPAGDFRPVIAERVTHAWHAVPHIHIGGELRAAGLRLALETARASLAAEISVTDLLLYTVAALLPRFPVLNTVWQSGKPEPQANVHLAFAVQTTRGVVAPVIQDADRLSLPEFISERKRLRQAAQSQQLRPADLERGTFTLTNLGMFPVDFFIPIINQPQSAILATGRVRDRVIIRSGVPQNEPSMWTNVAVDHRVADGATAAEFLSELEKALDSLEARIQRADGSG